MTAESKAIPTFAELVRKHAFVDAAGIDERAEMLANTRCFKGDGTHFLKVPGLLSATAVRVGNVPLPAEIVQEFPMDATLQRLERVPVPSVVLDHAQDGTPFLRRHTCSNFGIWQEGAEVYVTGEWDASVPAPELPAKTKKGRS